MSADVRVRACPDGPVLVRGADVVVDGRGDPHPVTRPVVALCVCGLTSRPPWCDGTHQVASRHERGDGPADA